MLFHSMQFLIFFPIVLMVYSIIPGKWKNIWLLLASYYFYICWNAKYALLLFFSTVITYMSGILLEGVKQKMHGSKKEATYKKGIVAISFLFNLAVLFYFKYTNFAAEIVNWLFGCLHMTWSIPAFDIVLPVGISFYTFQALGYTVDVYRGDIYAEKNFFRYALFVSFFPQLVAGPIERSKNLLRQMAEPKRMDYHMVREGLLIMLWGFFLKLVIADRCAVLVDTVYGNYTAYYGFQIITANVLFAVQIYCDFMGYSVIAKGAARILGFDLMDNFAQPYLAQSVKDFWRRWHISLSQWFRDYLYIPMGGSRCSRGKKYRNLFLTFLASGLWHGANITFVIWGGLHGLYQIVEDLGKKHLEAFYKKRSMDTESFSWKCFQILKTFVLVDIAWIFFRADTVMAALQILKQSLQLSNLGLIFNHGLYELGLDEKNIMILLLGIVVLAVHSFMKESGYHVLQWLSGQHIAFRYAAYWGAVVCILFSLNITGQEFIYFQF